MTSAVLLGHQHLSASLERSKQLVSPRLRLAGSISLFLGLSLVSIFFIGVVLKVISVVTEPDGQVVKANADLNQLGCVGRPFHPDAGPEDVESALHDSDLALHKGTGFLVRLIKAPFGTFRIAGERRDEPVRQGIGGVSEDDGPGEGSLTLDLEGLPDLAVPHHAAVMPLPRAFGRHRVEGPVGANEAHAVE